MLSLLGVLRAYWLPLALAVVAGLFAWQAQSLRADLAQERQARAEEHTQLAQAARDATDKARQTERERASAVAAAKESLDAQLAENRRLEANLAIARADVGRVRNQLSRFAAGGGRSSEDSLPACQVRAETLAAATSRGVELLDEGRSLLVLVARERDDFAAEVTACVTAWPTNQRQ